MIAFPTIKKYCLRCDKSFLTKDESLEYCNTLCEAKHKYAQHFNLKENHLSKNIAICANCGEPGKKGVRESLNSFCNLHCKKDYERKERIKKNGELFVKEKKQAGRKLPYEVLNKIAEKKRVFEDRWENYNHCRNRI